MILGDTNDDHDMITQLILDPISNHTCLEDNEETVIVRIDIFPKSLSLPPIHETACLSLEEEDESRREEISIFKILGPKL